MRNIPHPPQLTRRPQFSYRQWLILLLVGPGIVLASYVGYIQEQGNFHTVAEERVYRSRQLDREELIHYIKTYQIKSILNLRGMNKGSEWYQDEIRVTQELGVKHHDYGISANRDVSDEDLNAILGIIRAAPKPLLIHCKSGTDRTSLIAALYLYSFEGRSPDDASGQLSILHGHFPFFGNSTAAMDRTFWRYVQSHPLIH
jgi:protein tyrosine/serine phosphatase